MEERKCPPKQNLFNIEVLKYKWFQIVLECAVENKCAHTHPKRECESRVIFLLLPSAFPFRSPLPSICLSFVFLTLPLSQSLFLSLFLSVKVMQLIFLCLFIFQDWLWNVGSRQKPLWPLPSAPSLPSPPPSFPLSAGPRPSKNPRTRGNVEECNPLCPLPLLFLSATSRTTLH